jgi:hypothetical protein
MPKGRRKVTINTPRIGRPGWRRALPFVLTLGVALAIAGYAYSSVGPNAQLVPQDRLYGGGQTDAGACFVPDIGFCRPLASNFAIDAHATGDGQAAYGDITGGSPGFRDAHSQITCLRVHGQNAVVGAVIVTSSDPSVVGLLGLTWYVDRGTPAFGDRDLTSPTYSGPPGADWPPGFPNVCPSPDEGVPAVGLFRSFVPITHGDIVVQDAQ